MSKDPGDNLPLEDHEMTNSTEDVLCHRAHILFFKRGAEFSKECQS